MTQEKRDEKIRLLTHAYYLEQHPSLLGIPRKLNIDMDPVSRSVENTPKFQQELETDLEHFLAHHAMVEGISAWIVDSLHIRKEVDVRSTRYRTYRAPVDSGALTINSTDSDGTRQYEQWRDEYMQLRSNIFAAAAMAGNGDELARGYIGQTVSDIRMGIHNDALGLLGYQFVHFVIHEQKKQQLRVSEILPRIIQQSPVTLMELEHPNIFLER